MKLPELCEPLFQYICRLNRSARKGGQHSHEQVRNEVKGLLSDILNKAKSDPALNAHLDKGRGGIYFVLLFFVDFMIHTSDLSFASDWQNLAYEEQEMGGEQKFFDMLDQTLADRSEAATERVAIYYICMGLGFTGWFSGQPEYLRRKMLECSARLRNQVNADESASVCPEAYNADTRMLFKPIRSSLVGMTIVLVVLVLAVLAINIQQYFEKSKQLQDTLATLKTTPQGIAMAKPTTKPAATAPVRAALAPGVN